MSRLIELARAGHNEVVSAPETYRDVSEANAVKNFIAWMREHNGDGWWAACEIDKLFEQFCAEESWPRLRLDTVRQLMLDVPGVYRKRHRLKGAFEDIGRATGMERAMLYWIPPSDAVAGPWPDPARTMAGPGPDSGRTRSGTQELCEGSIR